MTKIEIDREEFPAIGRRRVGCWAFIEICGEFSGLVSIYNENCEASLSGAKQIIILNLQLNSKNIIRSLHFISTPHLPEERKRKRAKSKQ